MAEEKAQQDKKPSNVKKVAKFMFDIPSWLDVASIMSAWGWISSSFLDVFRIPAVKKDETFEQAMQRLSVTEEDLAKQAQLYARSGWLFLVFGVMAILYIAYIWHDSILFAKLVSIVVVLLFWVQAFRFSFLLFEIKQRRLGCSVKEWFNWIMRGKV